MKEKDFEMEMASALDVLNQELRVNGPIEVEQYKMGQMREGIRKLSDYFNERLNREREKVQALEKERAADNAAGDSACNIQRERAEKAESLLAERTNERDVANHCWQKVSDALKSAESRATAQALAAAGREAALLKIIEDAKACLLRESKRVRAGRCECGAEGGQPCYAHEVMENIHRRLNDTTALSKFPATPDEAEARSVGEWIAGVAKAWGELRAISKHNPEFSRRCEDMEKAVLTTTPAVNRFASLAERKS